MIVEKRTDILEKGKELVRSYIKESIRERARQLHKGRHDDPVPTGLDIPKAIAARKAKEKLLQKAWQIPKRMK